MRTPQLKTRLIGEIVVLVLLTTIFLLLFPKRHMFIDVSLALFAMGLLALDARFTRKQVWARIPSQVPERERLQKCLTIVIPVTVLLLVVCFITGFSIGYMQGGWKAAMVRVGNWRIFLAVALYLPWALLQQTLFQFYLFGRLLMLLPPWLAVACTALAYGLVHLPDPVLSAFAAMAGIFWSYVYNRYRRLLPLAFSHACLGAAFHYWVYGLDLAREWRALFG